MIGSLYHLCPLYQLSRCVSSANWLVGKCIICGENAFDVSLLLLMNQYYLFILQCTLYNVCKYFISWIINHIKNTCLSVQNNAKIYTLYTCERNYTFFARFVYIWEVHLVQWDVSRTITYKLMNTNVLINWNVIILWFCSYIIINRIFLCMKWLKIQFLNTGKWCHSMISTDSNKNINKFINTFKESYSWAI